MTTNTNDDFSDPSNCDLKLGLKLGLG
jgi:hypothetical protein